MKLNPFLFYAIFLLFSLGARLNAQTQTNTHWNCYYVDEGDPTSPPLTSMCYCPPDQKPGLFHAYAPKTCSFYVRLYTHVLEDTSFVLLYDFNTVKAIVDSLQADYNTHGIYLVWDSVIHMVVNWNNWDNPAATFASTVNTDGVDLFLMNEHLDPTVKGSGRAGYMGSFGGKALTYGNFPFLPPHVSLPMSKVNSHELGHVFGLVHTDNCFAVFPPSTCQENDTNCAVSGDFVCDTPWDILYDYQVDSNCTHTFPSVNIHNIMACTRPECMTHFTDGQGGRMRYFLATESDLRNFLVQPASYNISSNTSWNSPLHLMQDLIIEQGARLTITSEVYIAEDVSILVYPGAELVIDGGLLTNQCVGFWRGIQVWGQADQHQYMQNGNLLQGRLILKNNATIQFAWEAVRLHNPENPLPTTGGIVEATNSTIRNVRRGAEFLAYQNYWPGDPANKRHNRSSFVNCTFELDEEFPDTVKPWAFISMWGVQGINITGCTFQSSFSSIRHYAYYGRGIYCYDAGFTVNPRCEIFSSGACPPQNTDSNIFKNLWVGVWANGGSTNASTYVVNKARFDNCRTGLISDGISSMLITENDFIIGGHYGASGAVQWGMSLQSSISGFKVEGNSFVLSGSPATLYSTAGIYANSTGTMDNVIYRNRFENLDRGNQAIGINRFNANTENSPGLKYECNENIELDYDLYVDKPLLNLFPAQQPFYGIKTYQGSATSPAGNVFSNNADHTEGDFANKVWNMVRYYYYEGDPAQYPDSVSPNVFRLDVNPINSCEPTYADSSSDWLSLTTAQLISLTEAFGEVYATYSLYKDSLNSRMDGGNTGSLLAFVDTCQPGMPLYFVLMSHAPYLSEAVLYAVADRWDMLTESQMFNIMLANPGGLQNDRLIEYLTEIPQPLSTGMIDSLYLLRGTVTAETALTGLVIYYGEQMARILDAFAGHYLADSTGINYSELGSILQQYNNPHADYRQVEGYISDRSYEDARTLLADIEENHVLQGAALEDYQNFSNYIEFILDVLERERSISELDSAEVRALEEIAEASDVYTGSRRARSMLNFFYGGNWWDEPKFDTATAPKKMPLYQNQAQASATESLGFNVTVYPNPADELINFKYEVSDEINQLRLQVIDLLGKTVYLENLPVESNIHTINVNNWTKGIYVFRIWGDNGMLRTGKIIVQ